MLPVFPFGHDRSQRPWPQFIAERGVPQRFPAKAPFKRAPSAGPWLLRGLVCRIPQKTSRQSLPAAGGLFCLALSMPQPAEARRGSQFPRPGALGSPPRTLPSQASPFTRMVKMMILRMACLAGTWRFSFGRMGTDIPGPDLYAFSFFCLMERTILRGINPNNPKAQIHPSRSPILV
jgi:hypothetical protein